MLWLQSRVNPMPNEVKQGLEVLCAFPRQCGWRKDPATTLETANGVEGQNEQGSVVHQTQECQSFEAYSDFGVRATRMMLPKRDNSPTSNTPTNLPSRNCRQR